MLIAVDLDGTLVPNGGDYVGAYTASVLAKADDAGVPVVFVTARPLRWMTAFWPHVGKHGLAVVSNGAITYDVPNREVMTVKGLEPETGLSIAQGIADAVPGSTFAIECVDGIRLDPHFDEPHPYPADAPRAPLPEIWDVPAAKLMVRHPSLADETFRERVIAAVGEAATATWSGPDLVEISAVGVTKASALITLCRQLGVPQDDVVAFGDMPNDIPMLTWAGTSYAVANAHQSVLAIADHVCASCDDEGVAHAVEALL